MPHSIAAATPTQPEQPFLAALQNHNSDGKAFKTRFFEHSGDLPIIKQ